MGDAISVDCFVSGLEAEAEVLQKRRSGRKLLTISKSRDWNSTGGSFNFLKRNAVLFANKKT